MVCVWEIGIGYASVEIRKCQTRDLAVYKQQLMNTGEVFAIACRFDDVQEELLRNIGTTLEEASL